MFIRLYITVVRSQYKYFGVFLKIPVTHSSKTVSIYYRRHCTRKKRGEYGAFEISNNAHLTGFGGEGKGEGLQHGPPLESRRLRRSCYFLIGHIPLGPIQYERLA